MLKTDDWRETRRRAAHDAILAAAWELVREQGLSGLSIRELAQRAGITTPTVYAYFDSKSAIYDAMFAQGNRDLLSELEAATDSDDFEVFLREAAFGMHRFSTGDPARYQLLFQRSIPGFEPSPESYAIAVEIVERARARFRAAGIDDRGFDLWTCISTGLASQQLANDPGGARYEQLIDDAVRMFLHQVGYRNTTGSKRKGKR